MTQTEKRNNKVNHSDQKPFSSYNINTFISEQEMRIKIIISEPTLREMCRKYRRSRSHRQYAPSAATSDVFSRKEEKKKVERKYFDPLTF